MKNKVTVYNLIDSVGITMLYGTLNDIRQWAKNLWTP